MGDDEARRRRPAAVLLLVAALAAAACSSDGDGAGGGEPEVVPFERRRPAPPPGDPADEVAGPDVAECSAGTVTFERVTQEEVLGATATGDDLVPEDTHVVAMMARPGARCGLSAWPDLRLASSEGDPGSLLPDPVAPAAPQGGRLLLKGRQRIIAWLRWHSSCVPAGAEVAVEAVLADGQAVSTPLGDPPPCDPAARNEIESWTVMAAPEPVSPLAVTLTDVPEEVPLDGTLAFTVVLTNKGEDPVSLEPCPTYTVTFGEGGTVVHLDNELNCPRAPGEIGPGDELRFAVELPLPAERVPAGFTGGVFVGMDMGDGSTTRSADVGVRVADD